MRRAQHLLSGLCLLASSSAAFAITDEIQVYTGDIEPLGVFGLTWHNNYAISGLKTLDFAGGLVDNHGYSSVTEWAYGVAPWFEAGLYFPLYSDTTNQGLTFNGSTTLGQWRRKNATILANCAASCRPKSSFTNYGPRSITMPTPSPSKPASASA